MFYRGKRKTVPHSEYGIVLDILEATGWTWEEWQAQPSDLCDEMIVRFSKRGPPDNKRTK